MKHPSKTSNDSRSPRTSKIGGIAYEPDSQEGERDAISAPGLVIQDELRQLESVSIHRETRTRRLTSRKIQVAKLMLPKIPDKAS